MKSNSRALTIQDEETFTILHLTDLHLMGTELDDLTLSLIKRLVNRSHPDLICITGDLTMDPKCLSLHRKLGEVMDSFLIPWTYVFGNHDTEGGILKTDIVSTHMDSQYCIFESGMKSLHGVGNYHHMIKDKSGQSVMNLVFIDSNETRIDSIEGKDVWSYDYIYPDQIEWALSIIQQEKNQNNEVLPSLLFFHIPLPEYKDVLDHQMVGECHESISCSLYNLGFFEKLKNLGSTKGIFVGHDHYNDYTFLKDGILLAFGRVTGHYEYANIPFVKGGRIIKIMRNGTIQTSVLLETEV